ncbi:uncharacterized protein J7T55_003160 [Diaporthe amygdali]|uniref:uncharacterized protein n=1 Tax=Phomopsis amygdali TaxID=1214568 RepID=UPI0022FDB0AD|nr:uncharacterized protein J7T55_003160 [Diaporthe amygdali]KAJ0122645.1 uncharacterized protein J7T55_003160 [Diaporthe amygdali]
MEPFQYTELADKEVDIRLVTLLPGNFDDPLRVIISHVQLTKPAEMTQSRLSLENLRKTLPSDWRAGETVEGPYLFGHVKEETTSWKHPDPKIPAEKYLFRSPTQPFKPRFEALSYTWGTGQSEHNLQIISETNPEHTFELAIQKNLGIALRYLRHCNSARVLWVDAVCINQKDIAERDIQVTRMGDIYRYAERVIAWLGPESDDSSLALSVMDNIGAQVVCLSNGHRNARPGCTHPRWIHGHVELPYKDSAWQAIIKLFGRPWFYRLWVTQEVQLASPASVIQCGHDAVLWSHFRSAVVCLQGKNVPATRALQAHTNKIYRFVWPIRGDTFLNLLSTTYDRLCVDPRDKVYGLLGLASSEFIGHMQSSYALPVASVYRDTFIAMVHETGRLDALASCFLSDASTTGMASWVPDWSLPMELRSGGVSSAQLSLQSQKYLVLETLNVLQVHGAIIDTVKTASCSMIRDEESIVSLEPLSQWAPNDLLTGQYPTGETPLEAFSLSLVGNMVKENFSAISLSVEEIKRGVIQHLSSSTETVEPQETGQSILAHRRLSRLRNRSFITTSNGYFGLGPSNAEPGDLVVTILNCTAPIALRPLPKGVGYTVVGGCYIHGFGAAEALLGPLPSPWSLWFYYDDAGHTAWSYRNGITGLSTDEDPRLEPLGLEWGRVEGKKFRNRSTGDLQEYDPRLGIAALRQRGVDLRTFRLM